MKFTAKLTGNLRDTQLMNPKVLLIQVYAENGTLFRDHCWINLSNKINKFLPKGHHKPIHISFNATFHSYMRGGVEPSTTLSKISSIEIIKP